MSRFIGPRVKIIRRLGKLPGLTTKESARKNTPGQHGKLSPGRKTNKQRGKNRNKKEKKQYTARLEEKQKLRYHYGITERQLLNYIRRAKKLKGSTGNVLLEFLEMRLDCIVFRLRFAPTIVAARQMVTHRHILVNTKSVNIPSYKCQVNDIINIKDKKTGLQKSYSTNRLFGRQNTLLASHLTFKKVPGNFEGSGIVRQKINQKSLSLKINKRLIVEYYSRKI